MSRHVHRSRSIRRHSQILATHKAEVMTITGIVGFIASIAVTAVQAPKARDALDELEAEIAYDCEHEHIQPPTVPKKLWMQTKRIAPIAAPTVLLATFSTACIIGGQKSNAKQIASLTTAYELSEKARRDYIARVKERVGDKRESEIRDSFYEEQAKEHMPTGPEDRHIASTGEGDKLFFDQGTGRFFRSSVRWLDHCRHAISNNIFSYDYASANELADLIGLEPTSYGNMLGFNVNDLDPQTHLIDMRWSRCYMSPWGEPYAVLEYNVHERFKEIH